MNQVLTIEASVPISFLESRYLTSACYQLQDQSAPSTVEGNGRFNGVSVFQGSRGKLCAGISFDKAISYPYSISSEEGRSNSLLYRGFDRALRWRPEPLGIQRGVPGIPPPADGDPQFGPQAFQIGGTPSGLNPYPLRGFSTLPSLAQKMHGALFVGAGEACSSFSGKGEGRPGVEARMDVTRGYWLKVPTALGVAHGFRQGGENQALRYRVRRSLTR